MNSRKVYADPEVTGESPLTLAILVIGDEILRGDVQDTNAHYMAKRLNEVGAELRRIEVVGDDIDVIAEAVTHLSNGHDKLILCGGIGPTHDDVTMEGVARAFKVSLELNEELVQIMEGWGKDPLEKSFRRMAQIPNGAQLVPVDDYLPIVCMENVIILPGVPRILKKKFESLVELFRSKKHPNITRTFLTEQTEMSIAESLRLLASEHAPKVSIGSYPQRIAEKNYIVRITITSRDESALDQAQSRLLATIIGLRKE